MTPIPVTMTLWKTIAGLPAMTNSSISTVGQKPRMNIYKGNLILSWAVQHYSGFGFDLIFIVVRPDKTWCLYKTSNVQYSNLYITGVGYINLVNGVFNVHMNNHFAAVPIPDYFISSGTITIPLTLHYPRYDICYPLSNTAMGANLWHTNAAIVDDSGIISYFMQRIDGQGGAGYYGVASSFTGGTIAFQNGANDSFPSITTPMMSLATYSLGGIIDATNDVADSFQQKNGKHIIVTQNGGIGNYIIKKITMSAVYNSGVACEIHNNPTPQGHFYADVKITSIVTLPIAGTFAASETDNNAFIGATNFAVASGFFLYSGVYNFAQSYSPNANYTGAMCFMGGDFYTAIGAGGNTINIYSSNGTVPTPNNYVPNIFNPNLDFSGAPGGGSGSTSDIFNNTRKHYLINYHRPVSPLGAYKS